MIYGMLTGIVIALVLVMVKEKFMSKKSVNNEEE